MVQVSLRTGVAGPVLALCGLVAHAQGLPPETVAMADAALAKALATVEALKLGDDVLLGSPLLGRQQVSFVHAGQGFVLGLQPSSAISLSTKFSTLNIGGGPSQRLLLLMQSLAQPLFDACASIGGTPRYHSLGRWFQGDDNPHLGRYEFNALQLKLSGQHVCEIDGRASFAFAVTPMGRGERDFPYLVKTAMLVWAVPAREVNAALEVAGVEADAFEQRAAAMRTTARAGTEVQVQSSAVQLEGLGRLDPTSWVCALLLDRKEGLMQVQVGATPLFVPATAVVPRVPSDGARPGLPAPCKPVRQAMR
jgi:hypothetical protein